VAWRDLWSQASGNSKAPIWNNGRWDARMAKICWVDLGSYGLFLENGPISSESWQDHGLGLLRTIMHRDGVISDVVSVKNHSTIESLVREIKGYDKIIMNVRTYTLFQAKEIAEIYKKENLK
jgi:hypothetical protein